MKNYDMLNMMPLKETEIALVEQHKAKKNNVFGTAKRPLEKEEDIGEMNDLDEIADTSNKILDSFGQEVSIQNPMWKHHHEKKSKQTETRDAVYQWQKPPSRMSMGAWFLTLLILSIPVVNLVMLFVWAFFSNGVSDEKQNYCRAYLCFISFVLVVSIGIAFVIGKINVSNVQKNLSNSSQYIKEYVTDALQEESSNTKKNYQNLTDDDFTQ